MALTSNEQNQSTRSISYSDITAAATLCIISNAFPHIEFLWACFYPFRNQVWFTNIYLPSQDNLTIQLIQVISHLWDKQQPLQGDWHDFTKEWWNPFQGTRAEWQYCVKLFFYSYFIKQNSSSSTIFKIYDIHLLTTFFQVGTSSRCPISIMFEGT